MNSIQIIEVQDSFIFLKMKPYLFQELMEMLEQKQQTQVETQSHHLKKKIVPFFLNQFLSWLRDQKNTNINMEILQILEDLKKSKTSKQQRFELGDLTYILSDLNNKYNSQFKAVWKQFLQSDDIKERIKNNKKINNDLKGYYLKAIDILISELEKPYPYFKFLSNYKQIDKSINKMKLNNQQNMDDEELEYSFNYYNRCK